MKVFFFFSVLGRFFGTVANTLHQRQPDMRFSGVVYNRCHLREVRRGGLPHWEYVGVFSRFRERRQRQSEADMAYLKRVEAEYGLPNLPLMIYADRFIANFPRKKQLQIVEDAARFLERALDRTTPDVIVAE